MIVNVLGMISLHVIVFAACTMICWACFGLIINCLDFSPVEKVISGQLGKQIIVYCYAILKYVYCVFWNWADRKESSVI